MIAIENAEKVDRNKLLSKQYPFITKNYVTGEVEDEFWIDFVKDHKQMIEELLKKQ